jgi:hypothetical protein
MALRYASSIRNAPVLAPVYTVESNVLEGSKARLGYKNSEEFDGARSSLLLLSHGLRQQKLSICFLDNPVKEMIRAADKNYWKCNLAFIWASYYWGGAGAGDSISRWNAFSRILSADLKLLWPNHLDKNWPPKADAMKATTTDGGIVSAPRLPYTVREWISCHFIHKGAHLCLRTLCVNLEEED